MEDPLSFLLFIAATALASPWTGEAPHTVTLAQPLTAIAVDRDGAWAVGPDGAVLYGADLEVARTLPLPGHAVLLTPQHVWVCGAAGVIQLDRDSGAQVTVTDRSCEAIAEGPTLWLDTEVVRLGSDLALSVLGPAPEGDGAARLASADGVVVASRVGSTSVTEWSDFGRSVFRAGGPISAVAVFGGGARWSRADVAVLEGASREGLPLPATATRLGAGAGGHLAVGLLPGGAAVVEPGIGVSPVEVAAVQTVAVALDNAECPALWVLGEHRLARVPGRCTEKVVEPSVPRVRVGPGEPNLSARVGRPLTVQLVEANDAVVTWEGRSALPGLEVSADGRLTVVPTARDVGRHRVTLRMAAPPSTFSTGALWIDVAAQPVVADPTSSSAGEADQVVASDAPPPEPEEPPGWGTATHHGYQLGFGVGLSNGGTSWQSVGRAVAVAPSPALGVYFKGGGTTSWVIGAETMPTLLFDRVGGTSVHMLGLTAGLSWGGEKFQIGPIASAGLRLTGAGARVVWLPVNQDGKEHGVELRVFAYIPSAPAGHVALLYTFRERR